MKELYIFGIKFIDGSPREILQHLINGGVLVAPSGPGLSSIKTKIQYLSSLQKSTLAIFDSGLLCFALRLKNIKVKKLSGLKFLIFYLNHLSKNPSETVLLVNPSVDDGKKNSALLINEFNLLPEKILGYTSPQYNENMVEDLQLLSIVKQKKPRHILINIGGGTQEILADYLFKGSLEVYRPTIICTGAAIAFLTGGQAIIPAIVDRLYLGWLARCLQDPIKFVPRYIKSINLIQLIIQENVQTESKKNLKPF
jgi:UDP-N-acetyl-D-mannosaminuronic acid transferase (WecB/TagA/CpsF family)